MPIFDNPILMREIIMDHYKRPNFKKTPENPDKYIKIHMDSPNCIDDITIYILIENDIISEVMFDGVACAIATASTDIMCEMMAEKSIDEALFIINQYRNMMFERDFNEDVLGEALVFINTSKQAARIKCATIGWDGLKSGIKEYADGQKKN